MDWRMIRRLKSIRIWWRVVSASSGPRFVCWSGRITLGCRRRNCFGLGKDFGKGLQLINILRDYPVDLQAGRSYLPIPNLEEIASNPALARPEWERWRRRALDYLEEAWKYVIAVRPPASSVCLCGSCVHRRAHPDASRRCAGNSAGNQSVAERSPPPDALGSRCRFVSLFRTVCLSDTLSASWGPGDVEA